MMTIAFQIASDLGAAGLGRVAMEAIRGIRDAGMLGTVTCLRRGRSPSDAGIVREINEIRLLERCLPRRAVARHRERAVLRQCRTVFVLSRFMRQRANACFGTPVGGTPEILAALDSRLLLEGTAPEHIADGIIDLLHQRRGSLRADAARYARQKYSWQIVARRIEAVLLDALAGREARCELYHR